MPHSIALRRGGWILAGLAGLALTLPAQGAGPIPSFPEAQGYGATSRGGRGGVVRIVTNRNDSGAGSLRAAVAASGPRIVVFAVGGPITLNSPLSITNPYITIAGQTAPGDGVTLRFSPGSGQNGHLVTISTSHVVLRYLHLRRGETGIHGDSVSITDGSSKVMIDHCSITWATDENLEMWVNAAGPINRVTIQESLIAEALFENPDNNGAGGHPLGMLVSGNLVTDNWKTIQWIDVHHNVFAHTAHRNPRVAAINFRVINNVMYNWNSRASESIKDTVIDWVGNTFRHGPNSFNPDPLRLVLHESTTADQSVIYPDPSIHIRLNIAPAVGFTDPNQDNWTMITDHYVTDGQGNFVYLDPAVRRTQPLPDSWHPIMVHEPSDQATEALLDRVGAYRRLNCDGTWTVVRDPIDERIVDDVRNLTGPSGYGDMFQTAAEAAGGYAPPIVNSGCLDSDGDGMPNVWETIHAFNFASPGDGPGDADGDGYTNVEEFLNGTDPHWYDASPPFGLPDFHASP